MKTFLKTFSLANGLAGPPSACSSVSDRIDVFAVEAGGKLWRWSGDGANWSVPQQLANGPIPAGGLCAVSSGPDRAEVFAVDGSKNPQWWRGTGTTWTPGPALSGGNLPPVPVAVVAASPSEIDVFGVGADKTPWWWHWNGTNWAGPSRLPDGANLPPERIAAVSAAAGRLDVFAVGANMRLWHWWKIGASPWNIEDLGGNLPSEGVSAVSWGPDRIDVFAVGNDTHLWHWWTVGGAFTGPQDLGGSLAPGTVGAVSHEPGRLDVFAISRDQKIAQWQWIGQRWNEPDFRGENVPAGDVSAVVRAPHRLDVFVTGTGNTLWKWPGGGLENATNRPWVNWPGNRLTNPAGRLRPDNLEELVNIVQDAERLGRGVRAVGSGWSNSDAAVTAGYVVETDLLSATLTDVLSTSLNAAGAAMKLVHVEAGIKLDVLVRRLFSSEFEMKTLGGSSGQSLAGAVSTSVHGMDVDRGPLPDMVRAIHLVGPGGVQHWIEPSTPIITDKAALSKALALPEEYIHYDDDWFYSVLVSMGSLGIIYSMIIEVDPRYALRQTRANIEWVDIRARLAGQAAGNPIDGNRGVEVVLSPYPRGDGTRGCYLTTRNAAEATGLKVPADDTWVSDLLSPVLVDSFQRNHGLIDDGVNTITSVIRKPDDTTAWFHHLVGGSNPGSNKGLTVEFMFDASTNRYLEFVDAALEILRKAYYDEHPSLAYLGWISMRFQGHSRAYLSPQHRSNRTCSIEFAAAWFTSNLGGPVIWADTPTLLARIEAEGRKFGGIQHWGMNDSLGADDVARTYPRLDTWRRVRWELTGGGTITTFDSDFTRRCGLSAPPQFVRAATFDADNKTDIAVWRPSTGVWLIIDSSTGAERSEQLGQPGDILVPGDYDGDGKANLAIWRPGTGTWSILERSSARPVLANTGRVLAGGGRIGAGATLQPVQTQRTQQWGQAGDIPVPGDYDGDGKTDFAVWRPSTGMWWIIDSSTGAQRTQQWGQAGDIPVPGDYDGDGKTDVAVWRPSTGTWWIIDSSTGAQRTQQWGQPGDIPVPGKYDGDRKTDFAVWRPSTGMWWIIDSSTGASRTQQWGLGSDIPVPGDYDGDGKTDFAVWRPSTGVWWIIDSSTGTSRGIKHGRFGDIPV